MIRVAHVWRKTDAGGSEATFFRLFAAMDRQAVQWDFLVESTGMFIDRAKIERLGGRVILIPPVTKQHAYQRALRAIFRREKYDIVHAHMNELSYYPLKAAKAAGVPVRIAHAHAGYNWHHVIKTLVKIWLRPRLKWVATHAWAVSQSAACAMFGKQATRQGRVTVFRNALDLAPCTLDATTRRVMRQSLQIGNHQIVIGHVGRFMVQKNHRWLLKTLRYLVRQGVDAVLLLVGNGPLLPRVQRQIARWGLSERVSLVGNQTAVASYYQAMDVFMLPSWYEGLPGVAVEAQYNGLPCLMADTVTTEAVLLPTTARLPLKHVAAWGKSIVAAAQQRTQISVDTAPFAPFDYQRQAVHLLEHYRAMVTATGASA